jgi:positive regulator of sigma E activity
VTQQLERKQDIKMSNSIKKLLISGVIVGALAWLACSFIYAPMLSESGRILLVGLILSILAGFLGVIGYGTVRKRRKIH